MSPPLWRLPPPGPVPTIHAVHAGEHHEPDCEVEAAVCGNAGDVHEGTTEKGLSRVSTVGDQGSGWSTGSGSKGSKGSISVTITTTGKGSKKPSKKDDMARAKGLDQSSQHL